MSKHATIPAECYAAYEAMVAGALYHAGLERSHLVTGEDGRAELRCALCGERKAEWLDCAFRTGKSTQCKSRETVYADGRHTWRVVRMVAR